MSDMGYALTFLTRMFRLVVVQRSSLLPVLSMAVGLLLTGLGLHAAFAQQVVANATNRTATGTINTGVLPPTAGYALFALNNGTITSSSALTLITGGAGANVVQAQSGGSVAIFSGSSVRATGTGAAGLWATGANSSITATNTAIQSTNFALYAESNAVVTLNGGTATSATSALRASSGGTVNATNVIATATAANAIGANANNGTINITGGTVNALVGAQDDGLAATGANGRIVANGVTVNASGNGIRAGVSTGTLIFQNGTINSAGHAALANGGSTNVTVSGSTLTTTGLGNGLVAIGGTIDATSAAIRTTGTGSNGHGAIAESAGTIDLHAGTSITTSAFNSVGLGASDPGSRVNADALIPVTMNGRGAMGVYMHDGGQVSLLPGSTLQMNGTSSQGVAVDNTTVAPGAIGSGLTINLDGAGVPGQAASTGVVAFNGGSVALEDLTVTGANAAAGAWARPGSSITLSGESVININAAQNPTYYTLVAGGNLATATASQGAIFSVTGSVPNAGLKAEGGSITSVGTTINVTSGDGAAGVNTAQNGTVDMTDNTVVARGADSFGVRVDSGRVTGLNSSVTTSGGGAALFFNFGPGVIDMTNTTVEATGPGTTGLASLNGTSGGTNVVRLSGGSLTSAEQTAIIALGPLDVSVSNGAVVAGEGYLLQAVDQSTFFPQATAVTLNASGGSVLTGHALVEPASTADIGLATGSHWTGGAFDVTNVTVDPTSIWTITADSTVTQDVGNAGLVEFTAPTGDPTLLASYKTLTTQNYIGRGGTLGLNTYLGTDGSPSDILVIDGGTASGDSAIVVANTGGPGRLTRADGILVVDTTNGGTTAPGAFRLGRPAVAGPFEYTLERSSVSGGNADAWFLRSALNCSLVPTFPGCVGPRPPRPPEPPVPPSPEPNPIPHYRQEVSLYTAMPVAAAIYGRDIVDTLHERMGGNAQVLRPGEDGSYDGTPDGAWGRLIGHWGERDGHPLGIYGGGPEFDYRFGAIQAGLDLYRTEDPEDGSRDNAGLYAAFGHGELDVTHNLLGFSFPGGEDKFNAWTLGGYWTHFGPSDWYLDGILQATWYDATMSGGRGLREGETDGWGWLASIEGGYPYHFDDDWLLEPQAQLVYQVVDLSDFNDGASDVRFGDLESLAGRIGLRLAKSWQLEEAQGDGPSESGPPEPVREASLWLRGDLWHEFLGDATTEFSSADGFVPFTADLSGSWWKVGLGGTYDFDEDSTVYGNVNFEQSFDGTAHAWEAKLGVKMTW